MERELLYEALMGVLPKSTLAGEKEGAGPPAKEPEPVRPTVFAAAVASSKTLSVAEYACPAGGWKRTVIPHEACAASVWPQVLEPMEKASAGVIETVEIWRVC